MKFNNDSSTQLFIGDCFSVDSVIASDERELKEIEGSFEAIADRMEYFVRESEGLIGRMEKHPELGKLLKDLRAGKIEFRYYDEKERLILESSKLDILEGRYRISEHMTTRGFQLCPFEPCKTSWNDDVRVSNIRSSRRLMVNKGTVHLARAHHLLEKSNIYGISAGEFYEHFMPVKR